MDSSLYSLDFKVKSARTDRVFITTKGLTGQIIFELEVSITGQIIFELEVSIIILAEGE